MSQKNILHVVGESSGMCSIFKAGEKQHMIVIDEPQERGGTDTGANPL